MRHPPMRPYALAAVMVVLSVAELGCARPNEVKVFKSPTDGVFLSVETWYGHGPLSPDITKVYAHFERNGKEKKIVVLAGEELTLRGVSWSGPHDVTLCLGTGYTDTYRNEVTLNVGDSPDDSQTIYTHLEEHCP
jgi:hypothetical protein